MDSGSGKDNVSVTVEFLTDIWQTKLTTYLGTITDKGDNTVCSFL